MKSNNFNKTGKIDVYLDETANQQKMTIVDMLYILKDGFFWFIIDKLKQNHILN